MGSIPTGPTVVDMVAARRAGLSALVVSGVWATLAVAFLGLAAAGLSAEEDHGHDNGVVLFLLLIAAPMLTWVGVHLLVGLCLWWGQRWARAGVITAFGVSGMLPLWLFPLHRAGTPGVAAFVNAVLCAVVVILALRAR